MTRGRATAATLLALVLGAGCAPAPTAQHATADVSDGDAGELSAHPRWEAVMSLSGHGGERAALLIAEEALQWRSDWRCGAADTAFRVEVTDAEGVTRVLTDASCPAEGESLSVEVGSLELDVTAQGAWELSIEQYVDTMLAEPPLPEMADPAARVVGEGEFFGVERDGSGRALLFRLADGRLALRLEDLATLASPDLYLWVSQAADITTSEDAFTSPHVSLGELKSTHGHQNYVLPDDLDQEAVKSLVVWCEPMRIAYAAASVGHIESRPQEE